LGGLGGGLRTNPTLSSEPHRIQLALNDWFRFDKPGRYRFYLKSARVSRAHQPDDREEGRVYIAPVSNILEIEITEPDASWQIAKLREIETTLGHIDPAVDEPKVRQARKELVYLGTRGAVQLNLGIARQDGATADTFGLIAAPDRAFVISELDRYIDEPGTLITSQIIRLRTLFEFAASHPNMTPFRFQDVSPEKMKSLQEDAEKRQVIFRQMLRRRTAAMISLLSRKSETVREQCANAIAEFAPEEAHAAKIVPPEDFGMTREELIAGFEKLREDRQSALLTAKWDLIRGKEMIPALLKIVERARANEVPTTSTSFALWHGPQTLGESALDRLLQLAPEEGRSLLLKDIAGSTPRFANFAAHRLPAHDVPSADVTFTRALKQNPDASIPLIARFGTMSIADAVHRAYKTQSWPCEEENSFVAYFMRVRPEEGKQILADAMANREHRGCHRWLLSRVADIVWNHEMEEVTIATLDDSDTRTATGAAHVLAQHGSARVETVLWRKLEHWSEKWRGRAKERNNAKTDDDPERRDMGLGSALVDALMTARAWYFDDKQQDRLASLRIEDWTGLGNLPNSSDEVRVEVSNGSPIYGESYQVAQYKLLTMADLKSKMTQFPAATRFRWCPAQTNPFDSFTPLERDEMYSDLVHFLTSRQVHIEEYSKEACGN
jgi:hypothetical protein